VVGGGARPTPISKPTASFEDAPRAASILRDLETLERGILEGLKAIALTPEGLADLSVLLAEASEVLPQRGHGLPPSVEVRGGDRPLSPH
jgi:hypothetical protein